MDGVYTRQLAGGRAELRAGADLVAGMALVERCLTPAPDIRIQGWLARLQAGCASRPGSEVTAAVQLNLYTEELRRYPADVARAACEHLMRGTPGGGTVWFPTLGELIDVCDRMVGERVAIAAALDSRRGSMSIAALPELERIPPTAEEAAMVRAIADDTLSQLERAKALRDPPAPPARPPLHGRVNERGITADMAALLAKQRGYAAEEQPTR